MEEEFLIKQKDPIFLKDTEKFINTLKKNYSISKRIDSGANGVAFELKNGNVLKVTVDISEAKLCQKIMNGNFKNFAKIFSIKKLKIKEFKYNYDLYFIEKEKLKLLNNREAESYSFILDNDNKNFEELYELLGKQKNPELYRLIYKKYLEMKKDLNPLKIRDIKSDNLGWNKENLLAGFDFQTNLKTGNNRVNKVLSLTEKILKEFDYGNYLFGEDENVHDFMNYPETEKDTPEESKTFKKIKNFVDSNDKDGIRDLLPTLTKIENKFPKIFKPDANIVYRGLRIRNEDLIIILKEKKINSISYSGDDWTSIGEFNYTCKKVQTPSSWSKEWDVAVDFGGSDSFDKYKTGVILKTKVTDDFIFNSEFMNIFSQRTHLADEHEILCFADKIECEMFVETFALNKVLEKINAKRNDKDE